MLHLHLNLTLMLTIVPKISVNKDFFVCLFFLLWDQPGILRVPKICQRAKYMPVFYHYEEQFGNRATRETLQVKDVK